MAGAIQPRINKALEDALRADATLLGLLQDEGAILGDVAKLPLWWWRAPSKSIPPYLVYGPQDQESTLDRTLCGQVESGSIRYQVQLITEGIDPSGGLSIADRVAVLLDGLKSTVDGVAVSFWREGDVCYADFAINERGQTHTGLIYTCRVAAV